MPKTYRDPFSGKTYMSESTCTAAIEREHAAQLRTAGVTARQVVFNARNRLPILTKNGKSVISGKPTEWNERAGRYERFADDGEREVYRRTFLERMHRVHGKDHLLDDPDTQRMMLASRSISGTYTFADGSHRTYTGKEELALLKFLDEALSWPGMDVQCPAPQNFRYADESGKERFYIPDAYIESLNLIVEVKGELHNGYRSRDIEIERTKGAILGTSGYAYVKVEAQDYGDLLDAMTAARLRADRETV